MEHRVIFLAVMVAIIPPMDAKKKHTIFVAKHVLGATMISDFFAICKEQKRVEEQRTGEAKTKRK